MRPVEKTFRKVVMSHLGEHDIVGESALFSDIDRLNEAYCKSLIEKDNAGRQADQMSKLVDELNDKIRRLENENLEIKQRLSRLQGNAEGPDTVQST